MSICYGETANQFETVRLAYRMTGKVTRDRMTGLPATGLI